MPDVLALYWCTTPCGSEDWFVVAGSELEAATFHEQAEGFEEGEASAEHVADLPPDHDVEPGWASAETILACGGERIPFLPAGGEVADALRQELGVGSRVYRFGERVFAEGDLVADILAQRGGVEDDA